MTDALPLPPEELRTWVGPFADAGRFCRDAENMINAAVRLTDFRVDERVLEIGCGCGRIARAIATQIGTSVRYDGLDVSAPMLNWCIDNIESRLPSFHFKFADVNAPGHNPTGLVQAEKFVFPYASGTFELAIMSSVLTHMRAESIENYVAETARVLKPGGHFFSTVLLFDEDAATAMEMGTTLFNFRHEVGPCLTFDPASPEEGIAFREPWFRQLLESKGFRVQRIERGDWRVARSYEIVQDYVVAARV